MKMKRSKLTLNRRLSLIVLSVFVPMMILMIYLMYVLNTSNHTFDEITESITYANNYVSEFKERMDYSMYLAVIRGQNISGLKEGKVTVNGVRIVNPYAYIEEGKAACEEMTKIATMNVNESLPRRMEKTLDALKDRIQEIDANLGDSGKYNENLQMLEDNVYSLTEIIENGFKQYVERETDNFISAREEMLKKSAAAFQVSVITICVMCIVTMIVSILTSRSVTRPIRELYIQSRKVAKGDFTARAGGESEDEIAVLTDSFNDMTREIGQLVEDIKTEQVNLRIMESRLLQAQINPHFLYNTLDTIVWLAEQKQTDEVVSMVTLLSDFFRTTLSKGKDFITIEEEKKHVESYLKIQQFRYQDIMNYQIEIEKEILAFTVPKLTLQPLVENALYHGIKNKRGGGTILIRGYQESGKIFLKVIDNGRGMCARELERLRRYIAGFGEESASGFGLNNVNQRIRQYYGKEYGVFFESEENVGTEAAIIIPAKKIQLNEEDRLYLPCFAFANIRPYRMGTPIRKRRRILI